MGKRLPKNERQLVIQLLLIYLPNVQFWAPFSFKCSRSVFEVKVELTIQNRRRDFREKYMTEMNYFQNPTNGHMLYDIYSGFMPVFNAIIFKMADVVAGNVYTCKSDATMRTIAAVYSRTLPIFCLFFDKIVFSWMNLIPEFSWF